MTIDEALAEPGSLLAAWGSPDDGRYPLAIFKLDETGFRQLANDHVLAAKRDETTRELAQRGLRIGVYDQMCEHVWWREGGRFVVWGQEGRVLEGDSETITLTSARSLIKRDIRGVVSWVGDDPSFRGVRLELADGTRVDAVTEISSAPDADPTYSRNDLLMDAAWARKLGHDLAQWLGVPLRDEI